MARPRKDPHAKRDLRVAFRLSAPDAETLANRAKQAGLPVSTYARQMTLSGKVTVRPARATLDFETLDQLRRIGVNLNQLTRAYHRRGADEPGYLRDLCQQIEDVLDRAIDPEVTP